MNIKLPKPSILELFGGNLGDRMLCIVVNETPEVPPKRLDF